MKLASLFKKIERLAHEPRSHRLRLLPTPLARPDPPGESLAISGYDQLDSYSCGAVAGYMILTAFKPKASFAEFYRRCSPDPESGVSETRLVQALRSSGVVLGKRAKGMSFDEIREAISGGFPILSVLDGKDDAHWVVVYGYDMAGGESGRTKRVYIANYNFLGINAQSLRDGENPLAYTKYAAFARSYTPYVCWGK